MGQTLPIEATPIIPLVPKPCHVNTIQPQSMTIQTVKAQRHLQVEFHSRKLGRCSEACADWVCLSPSAGTRDLSPKAMMSHCESHLRALQGWVSMLWKAVCGRHCFTSLSYKEACHFWQDPSGKEWRAEFRKEKQELICLFQRRRSAHGTPRYSALLFISLFLPLIFPCAVCLLFLFACLSRATFKRSRRT